MDIKEFPTDYTGFFESIDPEDPYRHLNEGLFNLPTEVDNQGMYVYIPQHTNCSACNITLLMPDAGDPRPFLEQSGWQAIADRDKIILFVVAEPACGWESPEALAVVEESDAAVNRKTNYDAQRLYTYLVSYGAASHAALRHVFDCPGSYAGFGMIGGFECPDDLDALAQQAGDVLPYQPKAQVAVPVFIGVDQITPSVQRVIGHFKTRNQALAGTSSTDGSRLVYTASPKQKRDLINGQLVARVVVDATGAFAGLTPEAAQEAWSELSRVVRTNGVGAGYLHPFRTLEEWGVTRHEMHVGKQLRHWYEYVPQRNVSRQAKRPVVVFLHGGSQTAQSALYAAEWMNVAESRDFILVAPTGSMRDFGSEGMPHPAWNACSSTVMFDDEGLIRAAIDDLASREDIDRSRIYVTGHSMGSAMTQRCALALPDLFAAAASNSGVVTGGFMGDFDSPGVNENVQMPAIWIQMGEHDVGGGTLENNHNAERTVKYWIARGGLCDYDQPLTYQCGRYKTATWPNAQGVPLLSFTTTLDKPHSVEAQDAWFYYDEFFCKFSRDESGAIRYMGQKVI